MEDPLAEALNYRSELFKGSAIDEQQWEKGEKGAGKRKLIYHIS